MWNGLVVSLHSAPAEAQPMVDLAYAHAVPGQGIKGDRYFLGTGHFSANRGLSYEITLIESETITALQNEYEQLKHFEPRDARRNIVTYGVPLNHLVNKTFQVGPVMLRGCRLCEPCLHIAQLTHHTVLSGLIHRGGLRAQILTEGIIRVGDAIAEMPMLWHDHEAEDVSPREQEHLVLLAEERNHS